MSEINISPCGSRKICETTAVFRLSPSSYLIFFHAEECLTSTNNVISAASFHSNCTHCSDHGDFTWVWTHLSIGNWGVYDISWLFRLVFKSTNKLLSLCSHSLLSWLQTKWVGRLVLYCHLVVYFNADSHCFRNQEKMVWIWF